MRPLIPRHGNVLYALACDRHRSSNLQIHALSNSSEDQLHVYQPVLQFSRGMIPDCGNRVMNRRTYRRKLVAVHCGAATPLILGVRAGTLVTLKRIWNRQNLKDSGALAATGGSLRRCSGRILFSLQTLPCRSPSLLCKCTHQRHEHTSRDHCSASLYPSPTLEFNITMIAEEIFCDQLHESGVEQEPAADGIDETDG